MKKYLFLVIFALFPLVFAGGGDSDEVEGNENVFVLERYGSIFFDNGNSWKKTHGFMTITITETESDYICHKSWDGDDFYETISKKDYKLITRPGKEETRFEHWEYTDYIFIKKDRLTFNFDQYIQQYTKGGVLKKNISFSDAAALSTNTIRYYRLQSDKVLTLQFIKAMEPVVFLTEGGDVRIGDWHINAENIRVYEFPDYVAIFSDGYTVRIE